MSDEVITVEPSQGNILPINMHDQFIQLAMSNKDMSQLEKMIELKERVDATEARKAYFAALSLFQSKCPAILKKKKAHNSLYAPLGDIIEQVKDLLHECGLSYHFIPFQGADGSLTETCVTTHIGGHSESVPFTAPPDTTGSKNEIQALGSTSTYLRRYAFTGAFGIVTADEDMDGRLPTPDPVPITHDQIIELEELIQVTKTSLDDFCKHWKIGAVDDLFDSNFAQAKYYLELKQKKQQQ